MKMNKIFFILILIISVISCNKNDDSVNNNNPYLTAPPVSLSLNLNLPEYNPLKFPNNSIVISNQGIKGIVVYSIDGTSYTAFEVSDPNHSPSSCSRMTVETPVATCQCSDENQYNIISGEHLSQDNTKYPMLQYRAVREGDVITVFN